MRGMITVFWHELADNFSSWRFMIISGLVLLAGTFTIYVAANNISAEVTDVTTNKYYYAVPDLIRFVFLRLYTTPSDILNFSFLSFIVFFVPIVGIALGFDAINGEKNNGTLSRLLSLPIFRDAVINGKFLAGVATMAVMLVSIVMLVAGVGLMKLGVFPSPEEIIRLMAFLALSIVYGAFWLGLAMVFSIFFRRVATSALASIAIWIFVIFFMYVFAALIANMIVPVNQQTTTQDLFRNQQITINVMHISPGTMFEEASYILLAPESRTMAQALQAQVSDLKDWMLPSRLPLAQSLVIVWPQIMSLLAITVVLFAVSYIRFMREEIRST